MARRREFKGVALGGLGSFVSRYNDVKGYWGLGKLRRLAGNSGGSRVEIDLLDETMRPTDVLFDPMINEFALLLKAQLKGRRLPHYWIRKASVVVDFSPSSIPPQMFETAPEGDPFVCVVLLIDDLGREYSARTSGRCWAHDPTRERRRLQSDWFRIGDRT